MEKVKNLEFFLPKKPPKNKNHKQEKKNQNKKANKTNSYFSMHVRDSKERGYFKPNLCLLIEYRQTDHLSK